MCGIAGFIDANHLLAEPAALPSAMGDAMATRGPDGEGVFRDEALGVGLVHRRLAIFDTSEQGAQPMTSTSGRFTVVFNGAIYNFPELREELESIGHAFRGHSDTEVMLASFEAWGIRQALPRFNGMFAFAVLDQVERTLTLVRDRIGQKPLRFLASHDRLAFATDLQALGRLPSSFAPGMNEIDPISLDWYLANGTVPWPRSIRPGVEQVPPGGLVEYPLDGGTLNREAWWKPDMDAGHGGNSETATLEELQSALDSAVARRLRSDRPAGIFLSGGLDSRLIAGLAAQHDPDIPAFTLALPGPFDESREASAIARSLGLTHHVIRVDEAELLETIQNLHEACDEPFADSSLLATVLLARSVRKDIVVALGGDGGDELFGGYRRHLAAFRGPGMTSRVGRLYTRIPRALSGRMRLGRLSLAEAARRAAVSAGPDMDYFDLRSTQGDAAHLHASPMNIEEARRWLDQRRSAPPPWDADIQRQPDARNMMLADLRTYLPDDPLVKIDRGTMSVALETRSPFLDRDVVSAALRTPTNRLFDGQGGRAPIRAILKRLNLPTRVRKRGFAVPLASWLRGPLRSWAEDLILDDPGDPLDQVQLEETWRAFLRGRHDHATCMWTVVSWRAWLRSQSGQA